MPKTLLKYSQPTDSGTLNEDVEAELSPDGDFLMLTDVNADPLEGGALFMLYKPQVVELVKFLIEHGNMFNEIYSFYINYKLRQVKENKHG